MASTSSPVSRKRLTMVCTLTHINKIIINPDRLPVTNVIFRAFRQYVPNRAKHNPGFKLSDVEQK
jgi:hypothetical protein